MRARIVENSSHHGCCICFIAIDLRRVEMQMAGTQRAQG